MTFLEKLHQSVRHSNSTLCVGLDPNLDLLPQAIKSEFNSKEEQVLSFCKTVIDATQEHCAAFKPNLAFFEALGAQGFSVLEEVLQHIPKNRIVIADAKRGDISSTAQHYKKAFFDVFDVDAITLSPLMGFETLDAFSDDASKAIYALTLTSNSGADDFLKQPFRDFDMMAQYIAHTLFERSVTHETHMGMVIGATQPEELSSVIEHHSKACLLIPGIGAQGGSIDELADALDNHEGIPLINSSRQIIYAGATEENWPEFVAAKALETKNSLQIITDRYV
ncbi:MAG: orotidine-5'-phosphate decarboxylase [Balneolaceae bacterium]